MSHRWQAVFLCASLALAGCQHTIKVPAVDYTFKTPIATVPVNRPAVTDARAAFAPVFCEALKQLTPAGTWQACGNYLDLDGLPSAGSLPPLSSDYRVLVVAGILGACLPKDVTIYKQGIEAWKAQQLMAIDEIPVTATEGTKANAKLIRDYITAHPDPTRPIIAIGYSQGAADWLQAYADYPDVRSSVKALITVSGAVGGSRLADGFSSSLTTLLKGLNLTLPTCQLAGLKGLEDLRRKTRQDFLSNLANPLPRAYSVAAKSTAATTSLALQDGWKTLEAYSIDQDSQVIRDDAMVPGGMFLGTALTDHWGVSLPFREAKNKHYDDLVDAPLYPRTALLEAMVRFVVKDLKDHP